MRRFVLRFTFFSVFFPYFCSWIYILLSGGDARVDLVLHGLLFFVLMFSYFAFVIAFKGSLNFSSFKPSTEELSRFAFVLTCVAILFALINLYRVFGTLNPIIILIQNYLALPLRVVEYKFGGSPVINNLHMLSAFALSLNIFLALKSKGFVRVGYVFFAVICGIFTVAIPIKTMLVESLMLPYVYARLTGDKKVARILVGAAPVLIVLILSMDMIRVLTTIESMAHDDVHNAFNHAIQNLSFYFAAGFLNFNLVLQSIGVLGNGTLGYRLFAPMLDIVLAGVGADRLIQRGYTGKTLIDGVALPEIETGVNIYTSLLTFFMDFGVLFVLLVPLFWFFYASLVAKVSSLFGRSSYFVISLFLVMVVFSFGWSLKLFYLRFFLWAFVCIVFFSLSRKRYG